MCFARMKFASLTHLSMLYLLDTSTPSFLSKRTRALEKITLHARGDTPRAGNTRENVHSFSLASIGWAAGFHNEVKILFSLFFILLQKCMKLVP